MHIIKLQNFIIFVMLMQNKLVNNWENFTEKHRVISKKLQFSSGCVFWHTMCSSTIHNIHQVQK